MKFQIKEPCFNCGGKRELTVTKEDKLRYEIRCKCGNSDTMYKNEDWNVLDRILGKYEVSGWRFWLLELNDWLRG